MALPDLEPNGLLATSRETPQKITKPRPETKHLKPVPPNFFYRHDPNTTPKPRSKVLIGSAQKRKYDTSEETTRNFGKPSRGFGSGVALNEETPGKRRRVMGVVDGNVPDAGLVTPRKPSTLGKRIPLFMPSPSPEKPRKPEEDRENTKAKGEQAQMVQALLEGLDDPGVDLFDDELEFEDVVKMEGEKRQVERREQGGEELEMFDWMKVGDEDVKLEAIDDGPTSESVGIKAEVKVEPKTEPASTTRGEFSDAESEYADDFDYEAIDLDGIVATDADNSNETSSSHVKPPPSTYPIPNPQIHHPSSKTPNSEPVPWRRCIVESVTTAPQVQAQRFGNQAGKVLVCRVLDSVAASASQKVGSGGRKRMVRCELKGEWADLVLAAGTFLRCFFRLGINRLTRLPAR
jgi:hypothetical protein